MKKIIQKHGDCIGCGACAAVCSDFWEIGEDGKAFLKDGKLDEEKNEYSLDLGEDNFACNKDAMDVCPVKIISVQ